MVTAVHGTTGPQADRAAPPSGTLAPRIFAVADVGDAPTSDRPDRVRARAREYLREQTRRPRAPAVVQTFPQVLFEGVS